MVVGLERHAGEWTTEADTVVRVVRIDRLRVEGLVSAADAVSGLEGRRVEITDIPGQEGVTATGAVVFVYPEAISVGAMLRVWAEVENVEMGLYPGLNCTMTILPAEQ